MPVVRDIPVSLDTKDVLRRAGFRKYSAVRPEMKELIDELLASVKEDRLLGPAVAYRIYRVVEAGPEQLTLEGGAAVRGSLLPSLLPEAGELAIAVCTIGPRLEKQVSEYTRSGQTLRGTLLDGIGSAAVDALAQEACKLIAGEVSARGNRVSSPVSPGMPGLDIREQWNILGLVDSEEIGVTLTAAGLMVPRKSTSMAMVVGRQVKTWSQAKVCAVCNLSRTCPYRVGGR